MKPNKMNSDYNKENYLRLSGVTILYNPTIEVLSNLLTYIDYLDKLYIIDNSDVKSSTFLEDIRKVSEKCEIIINTTNYGIATALNQAVDLAIRNGFEWLLTMDQDSCFENNSYFEAFQKYEDKNEVGLFAPEINEAEYEIKMSPKVFSSKINEIAYTSGSIINLHICAEIGRFNEKLFIDAVDIDYCLRLLKNNYSIIKFDGAILNHTVGEKKIIHFPFNKKLILTEHSPIRHYYIIRNHTYILFKYFISNPRFVIQNYYRVLRKFIFAFLFHTERLKIIKYAIKGIYHCITNRFGKL